MDQDDLMKVTPVYEKAIIDIKDDTDGCDCGQCYCSGATPELEVISIAAMLAVHIPQQAISRE